ncbi:hypothetical protein [Streptomyces vietnamensis]|uniref:Uncharacterized protein n=1 Tax=Streptomyces vietnamensis TaxID=362257 RepID=A0A0B5IAH8_9ACTN|nr:hypothetical protein [Streptomyces vietnamensis]AJF66683.1 hypothetical protein SVTN_22250 [Streptomyces vietnamensis]
MEHLEDVEAVEDDESGVLLRDAMDRTTVGLPPLPDLAPLAVREGRRRRARARFAVGAAAVGVLAVGVLGLTLLPRPGADVTGVATHTGTETDAERERVAEHQRKAAALLDELLPAKVTAVRPVRDEVAGYWITVDGETYPLVFSVRRSPVLRDCEDCAKDTRLRTGSISEWPDKTSVQYRYRTSRVELSVYAGTSGKAGTAAAPLKARDFSAVAADPRFLALVKDADARPVEEREEPWGGPDLHWFQDGSAGAVDQAAGDHGGDTG